MWQIHQFKHAICEPHVISDHGSTFQELLNMTMINNFVSVLNELADSLMSH